jgi:hypothetical protein
MARGNALTVVQPAPAVAVAQPRKGGGGSRGGSKLASPAVKTALAAIAGGAAGALAGGMLVKMGVDYKVATIGLMAAGGVGAMTTKGPLQAASFGAAAAGAGQLALGWLAKQNDKQAQAAQSQPAQPSQPAANDNATATEPKRQGPNGRDEFRRMLRAELRAMREEEEAEEEETEAEAA